MHRGAWAETLYDFIWYKADNGTHVLTKIEGAQHLCNDLTSKTNVQELTFTKEGGWWGVKGDVVHEGRIIVNKDTWLILSDGATLTAKKGIYIKDGATLTIYAQSEGDNMGRIIARTTENDKEGESGNITIKGGHVEAYASGQSRAAAIGGGGNSICEVINIEGGDILAQGGHRDLPDGTREIHSGGAAIGGGSREGCKTSKENGTINISGGTIMAIGVNYSPSIGGGYKVLKSKINITGGDITCKGGRMIIGTMGEEGANSFVLNLGDEDVTGITDRNYNNYNNFCPDDSWYSVDGRNIGTKPAAPGLYIYIKVKQLSSSKNQTIIIKSSTEL